MSELVHVTCATCGTLFGIEPEIEYYFRLAEVGFKCPLGHGNVFVRQNNERPKKRERQHSATILKLVPPDDAA